MTAHTDQSGTAAKAPLVHIGYHKTGSTWFQQCLFNRADAGYCQTPDRNVIPEQLVLPRALEFDAGEAARHFAPLLDEGRANNATPVVSHERLSGNPHSGGYDSKEVAQRIATVFPNARILIVIREQRSMIASTYKQFVREGGAVSVRRYLHPAPSGRFRVPLFTFAYFEYHRLIQLYQELFGADRVCVIPFEAFRKDSMAVCKQICDFTGDSMPDVIHSERRNVGMGGLSMAVQRRTNFLFSRDTVNPAAPLHSVLITGGLRRLMRVVDRVGQSTLGSWIDGRMKSVIRECIGDRYRESNARTSALIGTDLSQFGYDMAAPATNAAPKNTASLEVSTT